MIKETGGPAFPHTLEDLNEPVTTGMSLRDYFASKAMQGDLIGGVHHDNFDITAKRAYIMADAMLKARQA